MHKRNMFHYLHTNDNIQRRGSDREIELDHPEKQWYYFILGRAYDEDLNLMFDQRMRGIDAPMDRIDGTTVTQSPSTERDCEIQSSDGFSLPAQTERSDEQTTFSNTQDQNEDRSMEQVRELSQQLQLTG